jgi:hypothetical protein
MNFTGSNYQDTRELDLPEIAKLVRADIRRARTGEATVPLRAEIRVRISRFSAGESIAVTVAGMPDGWIYVAPGAEPDYPAGYPSNGGFTEDCKAVVNTLDEILASYNYRREGGGNVRFFSNVHVVDEQEQASISRRRATVRARKAAQHA